MQISIDGPQLNTSALCEPVLRACKAWFGIESAVQDYLIAIDELPTFLAYVDGAVAGFFTVKQHFPKSAEAFVLAVRPEFHRCGVGRSMLAQAEAWLREQGVEYLQVKTLAATHPDPGYAKTRAFYESMGFTPLEVFPELWDEANPCLLMVKKINSF